MMNGTSIVVVFGFAAKRAVEINRYLSKHYTIFTADCEQDVLETFESQAVDLILCQHRYQGDSIKLLQNLRVLYPEVVRLISGEINAEELNGYINEAAVYQFVSDEWSLTQIELLVRRALEHKEMSYRHRHLSREFKIAEDRLRKQQFQNEQEPRLRFEKMVFSSAAMASLCNLARKAAKTNLPVLVQGETGTGKELIARGIHHYSQRRDKPLLVHNCGGMSDELLHSELFGHKRGSYTGAVSDRLGLLPAADGGTVFLDEIADVSPTFQVSLLRFLEQGEVKPLGSDKIIKCDVRIIAASNQPLDQLIQKGLFRLDLFYRLNGFQLNIPPLRKRKEEIEVLTNFIIQRVSHETNRHVLGISPGVLEQLQLHDWPGNVRELENEIKRMIAVTEAGSFIIEEQLSPFLQKLKPRVKNKDISMELNGMSLKQKVEMMEAEIIADALKRFRWNQSKTANDLGLSRVGLSNKIKRYGIDSEPVSMS